MMSLKHTIFPEESRKLWGKRWANVIFRSLHLCVVSLYVGGIFFDAPSDQLLRVYLLTALTGSPIILMDIYTNGKWLFQNRGWILIVKIILLGGLSLIHPYEKWGVLGIVILSGILSHATADFRYYSPFHRKRI